MARSTRMFEIIQLLRTSNKPITAKWIAEELEVTQRTIYRDIVSLQSMRIPIEGEAGIGYIMRPNFDLPPINFNIEESEAITLGLSMITRTGDKGLEKAAASAARKLREAVPLNETLFSSSWAPDEPTAIEMSDIRAAIRHQQKLSIDYIDAEKNITQRTVKPVALIYYTEALVLAAWCELREDFRHFRMDRLIKCAMLEGFFSNESKDLRKKWSELYLGEL